MRKVTRTAVFTSLVALSAFLSAGTSAKAQGFGYGGGGYGGGGYGQGYGGGSGAPVQQYYGNGGHDYQPHMHNVQTPFGGFSYYGLGGHDFRPHGHTQTPYGITGYNGGFFSNTQSYSPPTPYGYMPW